MARRNAIGVLVLTLALACAACTSERSPPGPASAGDAGPGVITVGSFDFPESVLLAYLYAGALSARGYPVRVLPDLGSRELVEPALMTGLVQLRAFMKRDPRDLLGEFRTLAPPRPPIGLQRWGARRVLVAAAMLAAALLAADLAVNAFRSAAVNIDTAAPFCGTGHTMVLSAQAVPSSRLLPCIADLPSGWTVDHADITSGRSVFWLDSDQAGPRAVTVSLTAACDTSGAVRIPSDQAGAERFERPLSLQPRFTLIRMYTFAGGCVTYQFSFVPGAAPLLAIPLDTAVAFEPRADLVRHVRRTEGLALCGLGAECSR